MTSRLEEVRRQDHRSFGFAFITVIRGSNNEPPNQVCSTSLSCGRDTSRPKSSRATMSLLRFVGLVALVLTASRVRGGRSSKDRHLEDGGRTKDRHLVGHAWLGFCLSPVP